MSTWASCLVSGKYKNKNALSLQQKSKIYIRNRHYDCNTIITEVVKLNAGAGFIFISKKSRSDKWQTEIISTNRESNVSNKQRKINRNAHMRMKT